MSIPPTSRVSPPQNALLGIGLRVAAMVFTAGVSALAKLTQSHGIPVLEFLFFRSLFALAPLALLLVSTVGLAGLKTRRIGGHLARSIIGASAMILAFSAVTQMSLGEFTVLQFTAPLFMVAMSAYVFREHVGWHRWIAVIIGFAGVLFMYQPWGGTMTPLGLLLGILSALGAAGAMAMIRQISDTERPVTIAIYFSLACTVVGLVGSIGHWVTPDPLTLGLLVLSGLIGGIAQFLVTKSVQSAPLHVVAPFDYTQLLWASMLGYALWDERLGSWTLLGGGIVVATNLHLLYLQRRRTS